MSISELYRAISPPAVEANRPEASSNALANRPATGPLKEIKGEFQECLKNEQNKLSLSQHAETRIRSRAIPWNETIERRINSGLDAAQAKGSRETLILADEIAVIANVKSRTVITAMDRTQLKEKIFTNIDSAVLV